MDRHGRSAGAHRCRRVCAVHNSRRSIPGLDEQPGGRGHRSPFSTPVGSRTTRHLPHRPSDPALLQQYGLTLHDVAMRVQENNRNFGGGYIEHASEQYTLTGSGRAVTTDELGKIVLLANQGTPVLLRDLAELTIGPAPRQGATLRDGETVSGM